MSFEDIIRNLRVYKRARRNNDFVGARRNNDFVGAPTIETNGRAVYRGKGIVLGEDYPDDEQYANSTNRNTNRNTAYTKSQGLDLIILDEYEDDYEDEYEDDDKKEGFRDKLKRFLLCKTTKYVAIIGTVVIATASTTGALVSKKMTIDKQNEVVSAYFDAGSDEYNLMKIYDQLDKVSEEKDILENYIASNSQRIVYDTYVSTLKDYVKEYYGITDGYITLHKDQSAKDSYSYYYYLIYTQPATKYSGSREYHAPINDDKIKSGIDYMVSLQDKEKLSEKDAREALYYSATMAMENESTNLYDEESANKLKK